MEKGKVTVFNPSTSNGIVVAADGSHLTFSMKGCNRIVAGALAPEFYGHFGAPPKVGDEVCFVRRFGNVAFTWGYESYFQSAEREIANRPIFRVMAHNRYDGQMMAADRRLEELDRGTVQALEAKYPRLMVGDRLAPIYRVLKCRAEQSWQVLDKGVWLECQDPRKKPFGLVHRVMRFDAKDSLELALGTPYELQEKSIRGSEDDKFAQTEKGEGNGYIYFMVRKGNDWVETSDPRPELAKKKATVRFIHAGGALA